MDTPDNLGCSCVGVKTTVCWCFKNNFLSSIPSLRLHNTFEGVLRKKIRTRVVLK